MACQSGKRGMFRQWSQCGDSIRVPFVGLCEVLGVMLLRRCSRLFSPPLTTSGFAQKRPMRSSSSVASEVGHRANMRLRICRQHDGPAPFLRPHGKNSCAPAPIAKCRTEPMRHGVNLHAAQYRSKRHVRQLPATRSRKHQIGSRHAGQGMQQRQCRIGQRDAVFLPPSCVRRGRSTWLRPSRFLARWHHVPHRIVPPSRSRTPMLAPPCPPEREVIA